MIIKFDKKITASNPSLFDYVESKSIWYPVYYMVDHRVRDSVNLQRWLADIISKPEEQQGLLLSIDKEIMTNHDPDYIMTDILRWVQKNIKYVSDDKIYKTAEKWQKPSETLELGTGDCEDGAILIYALAVACGVPTNRLLIMCGSVDGGGHCWLGYRPSEFPLNWCFMDWCYWFDRNSPSSRTKYFIQDTKIYDDPKNQYFTLWFAFNHKTSFKGLMNKA